AQAGLLCCLHHSFFLDEASFTDFDTSFLLTTSEPCPHSMSANENTGTLGQAQIVVGEQFVATDFWRWLGCFVVGVHNPHAFALVNATSVGFVVLDAATPIRPDA